MSIKGPQIVSLSNLLQISEESTSPDYSFTDIKPGYYPLVVNENHKVVIDERLTQADFGLYLVENNPTINKINSKSALEWSTAKGIYEFACHVVSFRLSHAKVFLVPDQPAESGEPTGAIEHKFNSTYQIEADEDYILPANSPQQSPLIHSVALENVIYLPNGDNKTALLSFTLPNEDCYIMLDAIRWDFPITNSIKDGTITESTAKISRTGTAYVKFTANAGHKLPDNITVVGADYVYSKVDSVGNIKLTNPIKDVTITIECPNA